MYHRAFFDDIDDFSYDINKYGYKHKEEVKLQSNCNNCAGPLNYSKNKCEYCGTYFKEPIIYTKGEFPWIINDIGVKVEDPTKFFIIGEFLE